MKKIIGILLSVILILAFSACNGIVGNGGSGSNGGTGSNGGSGGNDDKPPVLDGEYEEFFDLNTKVEIVINMSSEELRKLNEDYHHYQNMGSKSPLNRMCNVNISFGDKKYSFTQVGLKMKGNTSLRDFLNDKGEIDGLIHYKLNFAETFNDDYYDGSAYELDQSKADRKERRFLDMQKLDLKWNKNYDATHIKQLYAYKMFDAFGVMALKVNLGKVSLKIDNEQPKSLGVFEVLEVVDDIFFERRMADEELGGDLYKVGYTAMGKGDLTIPSDMKKIGIEDEDKCYFPSYDLKTNKKKSDHSSLKNLLNFLNGNGVNKNTLANYVDMQSFLMEEAVAYVLGNPDDFRNNYNNYYIYFGKKSGKAYFIPYDWDRCLGITKDWDPTGNAMTAVKHNSNWAQGANESQQNPLVRYTLGRENGKVIKDYNEQFTQNIRDIFNSEWCDPTYFDKVFNLAKSNYQNDVVPQFPLVKNLCIAFENKSGGIDGNMSFKDYITKKKATFLSYS